MYKNKVINLSKSLHFVFEVCYFKFKLLLTKLICFTQIKQKLYKLNRKVFENISDFHFIFFKYFSFNFFKYSQKIFAFKPLFYTLKIHFLTFILWPYIKENFNYFTESFKI